MICMNVVFISNYEELLNSRNLVNLKIDTWV